MSEEDILEFMMLLRRRVLSAHRTCLVCRRRYTGGRLLTCSDVCHEKLKKRLVKEFGEYKKITDVETGVSYKVPTIEILEKGLKHEDLPNYPVWDENE